MLASTIALSRFGLGARADEQPPGNAKRWLLDQLEEFEPRPPVLAQVPDRAQVVGQLADYISAQQMAARSKREMQPASLLTSAASLQQPVVESGADQAMKTLRQTIQQDYLTMNSARLDAALMSPTPFVERLVHFWANHFAVSIDKLQIIGLAGLLEFEAIRPHVLGKFSDMLLAVEQHPAMLLYLDQAQSIGPRSVAGTRAALHGGKQRGLNENLAREIMELHTLGARTGYSQADVTEFARALTGWTVAGLGRGAAARLIGGELGQFQFAAIFHEPGERTIMAKRYAQEGEAQARAVLVDLAVSPATAKHMSTKLARHFAGDDPPPALVRRLTGAYLASDGDLPTVYRALINSPEPWERRSLKFKNPWEWSVSALRAVGSRGLDSKMAAAVLRQLGQPTWQPGSPAGWDDIAASWAGPDALLRRVEVAQRIAERSGSSIDARSLAEKLYPGSLAATTRTAIARAESPAEGLALLLVSPEFVRR
jgi:uncharacterized protein (DUF1800 family)